MWVSETQNILNLKWVTVETNWSFCTKVARSGKNHFSKLSWRQVEGTPLSPSAVTDRQTDSWKCLAGCYRPTAIQCARQFETWLWREFGDRLESSSALYCFCRNQSSRRSQCKTFWRHFECPTGLTFLLMCVFSLEVLYSTRVKSMRLENTYLFSFLIQKAQSVFPLKIYKSTTFSMIIFLNKKTNNLLILR